MCKEQPRWHPVSQMPMIGQLIDGMVHENEEQLRNLLEGSNKPAVLDDYTVNRIKEVYGIQVEDQWLFEEQLARWDKSVLTASERRELTRLKEQLKKKSETAAAILALADKLSGKTIDKILTMDDAELGLRTLLGEFSPPGRKK